MVNDAFQFQIDYIKHRIIEALFHIFTGTTKTQNKELYKKITLIIERYTTKLEELWANDEDPNLDDITEAIRLIFHTHGIPTPPNNSNAEDIAVFALGHIVFAKGWSSWEWKDQNQALAYITSASIRLGAVQTMLNGGLITESDLKEAEKQGARKSAVNGGKGKRAKDEIEWGKIFLLYDNQQDLLGRTFPSITQFVEHIVDYAKTKFKNKKNIVKRINARSPTNASTPTS